MATNEHAGLLRYGFAPGHYTCVCIDCPNHRDVQTLTQRNEFQGLKGGYRCRTHATAAKVKHEEDARYNQAAPVNSLPPALHDALVALGWTPPK